MTLTAQSRGRSDRQRQRRPVRHDRAAAANNDGTVFEIAKTAGGYASTPTTLVSFDDTNGAIPDGSLIADSNGDLFGTTDSRRRERRRHGVRDRQDRRRLRQHTDHPGQLQRRQRRTIRGGSLIADANGDLFGTTDEGGANDDGTVFEIAKTAGGYASTPTTLVSFNGANGAAPSGSLIADANGDLFGTTVSGGANDVGTVFEIAKTAGGYASTPTTLVSFNDADGAAPNGSLIADANGDLFGTTACTAARTTTARCSRSPRPPAATPARPPPWSASTAPTAALPHGSLIADANGDLFGTTVAGGRRHRRRHGIRDRQDRRRLREHPHHPGQLQRHQRR